MSTYAATYSPNAYRASAVLTASPGQLDRDAVRRRPPLPAPGRRGDGRARHPGRAQQAHARRGHHPPPAQHARHGPGRAARPACSRSTPSRSRTCARPAWTRTPRRSSRSTRSWASCASPGRRSPTSRSMSADSAQPYEALAALIERELQLVSAAQLRRAPGAEGGAGRAAELAAGHAAGGRPGHARALPPAPEAGRDRAAARARGAPAGARPRPPGPAHRRRLRPRAPARAPWSPPPPDSFVPPGRPACAVPSVGRSQRYSLRPAGPPSGDAKFFGAS